MKQKLLNWGKRFSFKTGLIVLSLCVPFYIVSFAQMGLDISYSLKTALWIIFFGIAKTFQYLGLTILGVDGVKRLKLWFKNLKNNKIESL